MIVMFVAWMVIRHPRLTFNLLPPIHTRSSSLEPIVPYTRPIQASRSRLNFQFSDLIDINTVDLKRDEYEEDAETDRLEDQQRNKRTTGRAAILWKLYYWVV